jgi:hypothetical protein
MSVLPSFQLIHDIVLGYVLFLTTQYVIANYIVQQMPECKVTDESGLTLIHQEKITQKNSIISVYMFY